MDKVEFNNHDFKNLFSGRADWFTDDKNFFQEDGEEVEETEEVEEEDDLENVDPDKLHSDLEDKTDDESESEEVEETETSDDGDEETEEEKVTTIEKPESDEDYDLKDFGNHGGPDVPNNQYNEKDVEILNKLISSESDAINDYFDATTNTVDTNLSRLYGDIGREERFHLEQLLYAKSLITGEKYEPKDPEVKEEYEKLIGDGMDEDTAIITTMDKISISKPMSDEEFEEMKEDVAQTESYLMQSELFTEMILESSIYPELVQEYATRLDIYMEDVLNVNTLPKDEKHGRNPLVWLIKQFWKFINFLRKLGKLVREHLARGRAKRNRIRAFIKKNGITAIFQKGYSFYMYDDKSDNFDVTGMIKIAEAMYRTTQIIAKNCGFEIDAQPPLSDDMYGRRAVKPIPINSAEQGAGFIKGLLLTKSRVVVNENNEEYITNYLFGFSTAKVTRTSGEKLSDNFYNTALVTLDKITLASQYCADVLKALQQAEGDPSSIYRRNYDTWNKSVGYMQSIMKGFSKVISAINHDINTMTKIDDYVLSLTTEHDKAGLAYKGETIYKNTTPNRDNVMQQQQTVVRPIRR